MLCGRLAILAAFVAAASAASPNQGAVATYVKAQMSGRDIPVSMQQMILDFAGYVDESGVGISDLMRERGEGPIATELCPKQSYFEFIPKTVLTVKAGMGSTSTWQGAGCLQDAVATMNTNSSGVEITISGSNASSLLCSDFYTVVAPYGILGVALPGALKTSVSMSYSWANNQEWVGAQKMGISVLYWPCGLLGTLTSVLKTASTFEGEGQELLEKNAEFVTYKDIWPSPLHIYNQTDLLPADKSVIRSGDYLAVARLDGLDPLVMYGTGGVTGHSTVAVWDEDELYVLESTAPDPFGHVYWPPPYGAIRTPWATWQQRAVEAKYHVAVLPLAPELSAAFNETALWNWFYTIEYMPYGYHNMILSFLDTSDPAANLPAPIDGVTMQTLFTAWDRLQPYNGTAPTEGGGVSVYSLFIEAINHRTGTDCTNMTCVTDWLLDNDKTVAEITAVPELDSYRYDGGNTSMVCSVFAAAIWKHGLGTTLGVDPTGWQAAEQTPKDNYQLGIFDPTHFDSTNCPNGLYKAKNGNYCQMMGYYVLPLNEYNSIPPYDHMNNACPSQWPNYERCPPQPKTDVVCKC